MTHTVIGLFDNRTEAQAAMQELVQQGFSRENIDVSNRRMSGASTDVGVSGGNYTPDAVSTGSGTGGGIGGFFNSLFGDDPATATNYTNAANDADAILAIQVDSAERAQLAAEILDRNGAIDVDERGAQHSGQNYNQQNFSETSRTATNQNNTNVQGETVIPVIEEQLQVGKQEVQGGGARIRSRVIEKPVEASVRLREEHIVVNRRPVDRAATDADVANFKEGDITLTERSEQAVVSKQARVVEEVEIGKQVTEREETVRDTVRRTDVEVEETDSTLSDNNNTSSRKANS